MEDKRQESMHKDLTLQRAKLAGEITTIAALISNSCEVDVFIYYHGHVDSFEVSIDPNGWKNRDNDSISMKCYIGENNDPYSLTDLYKVKRRLAQILKDKKVNYDRLDYRTETISYERYYLI